MISIIIPNWNGLHLLKPCLDSLLPQLEPSDELIIVDNGSTDGSVEWLQENIHLAFIVRFPKNMGFAAAVNAGIRKSASELIVLLNNDTEVQNGWLNALRMEAKTHMDFAIFASRVVRKDPPGYIDTVGDGFTIAGFGYKIGWMEPDDARFDHPAVVFGASACAALYRRCVFDAVGLFDEDFFAFAEDLDISFRALLAGFRVRYCPTARVIHKVRATASAGLTLRLYYRNLIWLIYKDFPSILLFLYFCHILGNFTLAVIRGVIRKDARSVIGGIRDGIAGIPGMRNKRKQVQSGRTITISELRRHLDANWLAVHWRLSSLRRRLAGGAAGPNTSDRG